MIVRIQDETIDALPGYVTVLLLQYQRRAIRQARWGSYFGSNPKLAATTNQHILGGQFYWSQLYRDVYLCFKPKREQNKRLK